MTSYPDPVSADYKIPKPSRLNLRETLAERTARLKKAAKKEFDQKEEAIRKANKGYSDIPSYSTTYTSTSASRVGLDELDDTDDPMSRAGMEANLARPSASGSSSSRPDIRIPSRYQTTTTTTTTTASTSTTTSHSTTHTSRTHYPSNMTDAEIQQSMYREMADKRERDRRIAMEVERKNRKQAECREAEAYYYAQKKQEKDTRKEKDRIQREWERRESPPHGTRARKGSTPVYGSDGSDTDPDSDFEILGSEAQAQGRKKGKKSEREKAKKEDKRKLAREKERERYLSRWTSLLSTTEELDGITETELSYSDIPWPIYRFSESTLDKTSIKTFLSHLARSGTEKPPIGESREKEIIFRRKEERKVLREAIKNFHPDRFLSKVLPRVREGEREQVKEGMEICSRVLTELIMDNSSAK